MHFKVVHCIIYLRKTGRDKTYLYLITQQYLSTVPATKVNSFKFLYTFDMTQDADPYVIYGGDPGETTKIDANCPSLGAMTMLDFKLGENKTCLVTLYFDY